MIDFGTRVSQEIELKSLMGHPTGFLDRNVLPLEVKPPKLRNGVTGSTDSPGGSLRVI